MELLTETKTKITEIIMNIDDDGIPTAEFVQQFIVEFYDLWFSVENIQERINDLVNGGFYDDDRCDKTIDMFEVA